jgi:hypothetical protein
MTLRQLFVDMLKKFNCSETDVSSCSQKDLLRKRFAVQQIILARGVGSGKN